MKIAFIGSDESSYETTASRMKQECEFINREDIEEIRRNNFAEYSSVIIEARTEDREVLDLIYYIRTVSNGIDVLLMSPRERPSAFKSPAVVKVGNMTIDIQNKALVVRGSNIHLTTNEYIMLELLALNKGFIVSKKRLLSQIKTNAPNPSVKTIDVYMCNLRTKLKIASGGIGFISTVRCGGRRGYVLSDRAVAEEFDGMDDLYLADIALDAA